MKSKINLRLVGIAVLAIVATVVGITIVYYGLFKKQVRADLKISAKLLRDTHYFEIVDPHTGKAQISGDTVIDINDINDVDLSTNIKELRVTWIDSDGKVLYDNDATAESLSNHMDRPEIKAAFEEGSGESVRKSDTLNKNTFYYAVKLSNGTVLRVATNAESLKSVFISVAPMTMVIIFCIAGICIAISHLLTRQLISPIETMAEKLEDVEFESPYKELEPFSHMIRAQHADILSAAKARQDFTANVSHELKTPLTAISGYAELLEGGMVNEEQRQHFYQEIRKNSDRLLALINDILKLSELDRSERESTFEEVNLYDIASDCMEALSVNAKQRGVSLLYNGESCVVRGNKDLLRELVENLVQNSIRYNNQGGKVVVTVEKKERPVLIVKDNGIGIPLADQGRVFERFYRVDKSRSKATGGTGLGLAIVKHIVDIHGGTIELDSAVGVGTTIAVYF